MVKPGREAEFIRSWSELAEFTALRMVGRKEASRLLRDHDQPNRFVSPRRGTARPGFKLGAPVRVR